MNSATGGNIIYKFIGDKSGLESTTKSVDSSFKGMTKSVFAANIATKAVSAGFNMIRNNAGEAVKRLDTLNNYPKVMSNLGIGTKEANASINKMSKALMGLPTTLDAGAMAVQRLTSKNSDIRRSTDMFLALNDAILAGGAPMELQASALEQISQAYSKNKPDMMEWRTIMSAMPAQMKQVAQAMNILGTDGKGDTDALGAALRDGSVSMEDFMSAIMKLDKEGVPGFQSFSKQAKNTTDGMQTNIANAKNAVVRGVASIMTAINKGLEKAGLGNIGELLLQAGKKIEQLLNQLAPYITNFIVALKNMYDWMKKHETLVKTLAIIIISLVGAFKLLTIIASLTTIISGFMTTIAPLLAFFRFLIGVVKGLMVVLKVLWGVMMANPIFLVIAAIVALVAIFVVLWNKCEWFRNFWIGLWEKIKTAFVVVWTVIKTVFLTVVNYFRNQVKAFVSVATAIYNAFKSLPNKLLNIGKNIALGLWNGIQGMKNWVINKVKALGKSIINGLKNALGIHSPSTEFAMIGRFSVLGYTEALDRMQGDIQDKVQETFGISPQLTGTMSNHFSPSVMVNNDINVSTDPLGQTVKRIKTFSGGAKNDYNYGMGV